MARYSDDPVRHIVTFRVNSEEKKILDQLAKKSGRTVGADQGILTCLTLSDGQITQKCNHGHDLSSIQRKMNETQREANPRSASPRYL